VAAHFGTFSSFKLRFVPMATSPLPGLNIARYPTDPRDSDGATARTVELMCAQINRAAGDPVLRSAARDAVRRFRGGPLYALARIDPWKSPQAICESAWWWVKHALKFVHHDGMIAVWFNERDQLQLLIAPDLLLRMFKPRGDCAIYTMLICGMLKCFRVPYELVTAAVNPDEPDVFSHVYPRAVMANGRRIPLDASHGDYPGWEVPRQHTLRKQVWDEDANPIPDEAPRFKGLHSYAARPTRPILPKRIAMIPGVGLGAYIRWQRGLGQTDTTTTVLDPSMTAPITNPVYTGTAPAPGFPWAQTFGNLLNQWTQIGGRVIAPTTTYQSGPGGTSISTPAGSGFPSGVLPIGSTGGSSLLLLGVGALGLILLFSMLSKK
jgi:hypothetical protein